MPKKESNKNSAKTTKGDASSRFLKLEPDQMPVTSRRAEYLAEIAKVDVKELKGKKIAEVHDVLKWKLEPELLAFRRVCGKVVKRDPVTGELEPVPNATVHVEDTDCSFWGFFPVGSSWAWLYPGLCSREDIATVRTDECGQFCVFLPYWDIDRVLRFRKRRICYLRFFKPRIRDLIELLPEPPIIRNPIPEPDPLPIARKLPELIDRIRDQVSHETVERLEVALDRSLAGEGETKLEELLDEPAFTDDMPPPLPERMLSQEIKTSELADIMSFNLDESLLDEFNPRRFIGPFIRCVDIYVPTWVPILDVPDITFRVTQDYDLDGVEEDIYSESFFDVRWNAGPIMSVTLEASGSALSVPHCRPVSIPCGNKASIESAGYLDLESAYHDDTTGFGIRVNRPTTHGYYPVHDTRVSPGNAPYAGNLNLHGCFRLKKATHYRVTRSFRTDSTQPWGPQIPINGVTWMAPRQGPGAPIPFIPDGDGWYQIQPAAILVHPNWILPWRSWASPGDGGYQLRLQLGRMVGGSMNIVDTSAPRTFEVDNSKPASSFVEIRWRDASIGGPWTNTNSTVVVPTALPNTCPVINRPTGMDIHLRVIWMASSKHLRDARLDQYGCGGGHMEMIDSPPAPPPPTIEDYRHWHSGPFNNAVSQTNFFLLRGTRPPGCYTVRIRANSRAYNPQDWDAASTHDWWVDQAFRWFWRSRTISIVDV